MQTLTDRQIDDIIDIVVDDSEVIGDVHYPSVSCYPRYDVIKRIREYLEEEAG